MSPPLASDGSRAVALFNESDDEQTISTTADEVGVPDADTYRTRDLWQQEDGTSSGTLQATVPAHGTVLLKVTAD